MTRWERSAEPLDRALRGLVGSGALAPGQADAVRAAVAAESAGTGVRWTEILGYLGGGLVIAGAGTLVAVAWEDFGQALQVLVLAVVTLALAAAAALAAGGPVALVTGRGAPTRTRARVSGVLLALAALSGALAAWVAVGEHSGLVSASAGLVIAVAGYAAMPTAFGLLVAGYLSAAAALSLLDELRPEVWSGLETGLTLIALGAVWVAVALTGVLANRSVGLGIGALIALVGGQASHLAGESVWAYSLTFAVAAACLLLYGRERRWVLLVAGVVGVTVAAPEAVWDWTGGALGGAAILLVAGVVLLIASGIGIAVHRNAAAPPDGPSGDGAAPGGPPLGASPYGTPPPGGPGGPPPAGPPNGAPSP
ncbi:DUF2157 domain-containing protein [Allonocardiopsis opalescens]|uniref:Putative membrane protein DUF2157 n=1 Tax=Allonocardiopsis opalescens TaxID=1144618 RepID=A0A2T0Q735_9ACTN|nr:DUF2157 domain-containing protein [Allonocardiopsis opalescens]PRX99639.1 putative membrane protein DUF2157 [Allonocardiopsis opalescens]